MVFVSCDSTARHSTAQHGTAQHSTAQHSTAQHSTARHSAGTASRRAALQRNREAGVMTLYRRRGGRMTLEVKVADASTEGSH